MYVYTDIDYFTILKYQTKINSEQSQMNLGLVCSRHGIMSF